MQSISEKSAGSIDQLTVLLGLKDLAKRWHADGTVSPYGKAKNCKVEAVAVRDIHDLHRVLSKLERDPRACIIRGRFVGYEEAARREELERDGYVFRRKSTFEDQPLHAVMLDVDGFEPIAADPVTQPTLAIREFLSELPEPFRRASCHWQLSNRAGHADKAGLLCAHLWFWLAEPRTSAAVKAWAERAALPVDLKPFDEIQIHYTSAPLFDAGVADPVPVRSGFIAGETDAVAIDIPDLPAAKPRGGQRAAMLGATESDPIAQHLAEHGFVKDESRDGKLPIRCPFEAEHTTDSGPTSTVYLLPHFNGFARGELKCQHAHCRERTRADFLDAIGYDETADDFDVIDDGAGTATTAQGESPKPECRVIRLEPGRLPVYARQAEGLLAQDLYERDNKLVRIAGALELTDDTRKVTRNAAQPVILEAGAEYVIRRLGELARFEALDARAKKWKPKDCPAALARNIVEQKSWPAMRRLTALASAPFMRPDFTVCSDPGYDAATGTFYVPNARFPTVPEAPTMADAAAALAVVLAPFEEFPFVSEASRAAFASNILTEAVRLAIDTAPVFTYSAPVAGTGKTLLAEMAARIVHGNEPAKRAWAEGDELRKVLFASLLVGDRSILFDNAQNGAKVRAPVLCNFATAPLYSDRKLGVSETPAMPNRAVVSMTGNNITPTSDLARRSIVIRLVARGGTAVLRQRRFRIRDLKGYVAERRPELLAAVLTIVRAFVTAGCPEQAVPLPSFEQWSKLARDPLLWLGLHDPVQTQAEETDDETAPLGSAFAALGDALKGREFTAAELADLAAGIEDADGELRKVLEQAGCSDPGSVKALGYWLRGNRDREEAGWQLQSAGKGEAGARWRLVNVAAGLDLV